MKIFRIVKSVVFLAAGILTLVLHDLIMKDEGSLVGIIVGSAILLYGLDMTFRGVVERRLFGENYLFFGALSQFLIAAALFAVSGSIESVCVIWAVWSILREGKEMSESLHRVFNKKPGLLNIAESVVIIVFSFMMMMEPSEHHASFHIYLLGIELILEIVFMFVNLLFDRMIEKKRKEKGTVLEANVETAEAAITDDAADETPKDEAND